MTFISVTFSVLFTQDVARYKTLFFLMFSCISSEMEMYDFSAPTLPASIETRQNMHNLKTITEEIIKKQLLIIFVPARRNLYI